MNIWLEKHQILNPLEDENFKELILQELKEIGKKNSLADFQIPKKIILDKEEWSFENNLLTTSFKVIRKNVIQKFNLEISKLFQK
jgi:fatty acid CoA ligase FadD9